MSDIYEDSFADALSENCILRGYLKVQSEGGYPNMHCNNVRRAILSMDLCVSKLKTKCENLQSKLSEKELAYDEITQALLNTEFGRQHHRNNTVAPDILSHIDAAIIISDLDKVAREAAALDEIPFGATEPDHEVSVLQRRVAELEMQLDFERSHKSDLQLACLNFCAGITADIQKDLIGGEK